MRIGVQQISLTFILIFAIPVICGLISKSISSSRGMKGGFWWGFFLSIIGIIVVAVRPNDSAKPIVQETSSVNELEKLSKLREQGLISEEEYDRLKRRTIEKY